MEEKEVRIEKEEENSLFLDKEIVSILKKEINLKNEVISQKNNEILALNTKISLLLGKVTEIEQKIDIKNISSIGNRGVNNNQQQSTITARPLNVEGFKEGLELKFKSLTDREFSVFLAIYQLEEELGRVTYPDIANKLKISEITIRCYVNSILNKNIPVERRRHFNKKSYLTINNQFRSLNLVGLILKIREGNEQQPIILDPITTT
ncbi:hypothetical protein HYX19_02570 [Candidatus Woesearchaeota archaeon]|nr:hypothetical protein [Candidatus Woesearchaeota archaeon]